MEIHFGKESINSEAQRILEASVLPVYYTAARYMVGASLL